ncbi:hypothetical protein ES703_100689 [subsurface metagenome]
MATIVFLEEQDEIIGSIKGLTFDRSQAGNYVKKRPSPINHQTNDRMKLRALLKETNAYYWTLTPEQMWNWAIWTANNVSLPPFGMDQRIAGCYGFFTVELNARIAGDPFYPNPPGPLPLPGVTFTNLARIDKDTIRATFNPSPAGADDRIFLRQTLPGPGVRRWSAADGYIAEVSGLNPASPYDFTTHFQQLAGWHCRYWTGTQQDTGRRSDEDLWDL